MKIGIVDIETTGWLKSGGSIVEVGIVSLDTETGETEIVFDSVCKEPGMTAKDREAWKHFFPEEPYIELHRGADDALHEAKIVHELYTMGKMEIKPNENS